MRTTRTLPAALLAGSLLVAACGGGGGGDGDATSQTTTTAAGASSTTAATGGSTTTSGPVETPTSMAGWERLWTSQREAIVKKIEDSGWGLSADGKTLNGPSGFTIDLSKCPAGWSNTEGLTDTSIKIGNPTPQSGTLADAGNISKAMGITMEYYSAQGLFKDSTGKTRTTDLIVKDDGYDPARTIPIVDELLDSEKVFDIWGLGSPNVMKTYDKINARCVPHLFAITGHPAWGDPVNHPWTTGILMAYNTEAVLWGSFIEQRLAEFPEGKVKVAALIMNNDFGKAYDAGFKAYLAQSASKDKFEYVTELIEPQAPTVKDPMTNLAAQRPDVFIQMLAGTACTQSIVEAAENGLSETATYLFAASVCKASTYVGEKVAGSAPDGWWIMGGGFRDMNSPAEDTNPWIVWGRELLASKGIDHKSSGNLGTGVSMGWNMSQALAIAGALDGGLTRTNLMIAARAMDMTNPAYLEGIRFNLDGSKDAYWIEGSEVAVYDVSKQQWVPRGAIVELSGKSSNCAWDQATATCG